VQLKSVDGVSNGETSMTLVIDAASTVSDLSEDRGGDAIWNEGCIFEVKYQNGNEMYLHVRGAQPPGSGRLFRRERLNKGLCVN
jgi:hypothetical protein